jgi:hypothetical protein
MFTPVKLLSGTLHSVQVVVCSRVEIGWVTIAIVPAESWTAAYREAVPLLDWPRTHKLRVSTPLAVQSDPESVRHASE